MTSFELFQMINISQKQDKLPVNIIKIISIYNKQHIDDFWNKLLGYKFTKNIFHYFKYGDSVGEYLYKLFRIVAIKLDILKEFNEYYNDIFNEYIIKNIRIRGYSSHTDAIRFNLFYISFDIYGDLIGDKHLYAKTMMDSSNNDNNVFIECVKDILSKINDEKYRKNKLKAEKYYEGSDMNYPEKYRIHQVIHQVGKQFKERLDISYKNY